MKLRIRPRGKATVNRGGTHLYPRGTLPGTVGPESSEKVNSQAIGDPKASSAQHGTKGPDEGLILAGALHTAVNEPFGWISGQVGQLNEGGAF